ncbi:SRPBCC family protein [Haloarchaeobius sp. DFWS5]|uniref:SRPBCC family protein n=1 Tax=Haloarchaeobius sp. DFWS5 TaxID=3446114 RepID=UPI003EBCDEB7
MKATATVTVDRPVADVFEYISNVERMSEWVVGVGETTRVAGDGTGVGDRYESEYTYGGKTHDMTFEVTEYESPTRLGITAPEGPFAFDGLLELEAVDGKTHVSNTIETGADGRFTKFMFTVFRPVMRYMMRRQLRKELVELKSILEGDGDQRPPERAVGAATE